MNDRLDNALKAKGIRSHDDRLRFALKIGISERSLRRWRSNEEATPHWLVQELVAKKLGATPEQLWPEKERDAA